MRIALIIPTLDRSGAEKQLTLLACGLKSRHSFDPIVITLDRSGPYEAMLAKHDIDVRTIGKRSKFDLKAARRLRGELKSIAPHVIHTWLFSAHAYGYLAARRANIPWVQSLRCVDSWKAGWQRWVDHRLWPRVTRFVANSESVKTWYAEQGVALERIDVISNGVALPHPIETNSVRGDLGLPDDANIVLTVGRLAPQKRLKDLLWAFQLTRQAKDNTWLLIVGDGPQKSELIDYAKSVESYERVRFVGHSDDPASYFEAANVFWLGSDFEGQSNSLQEAMAYGLPIVTTDIGPNRELVTHNEHGFLVDVGDSAGFAQFTMKLLGETETAAKLGQAARERIELQFGVEKMVDQYASLYQGVTSSV